MWDDGADPVGELRRMMEVRRVALARFGTARFPPARSLPISGARSFLIWLLDRYQIEAAAKSLGGVDFPYAVNGEPALARTVAGATQWAALYALLDTHRSGRTHCSGAASMPLLSSGFGGNPDRQTDIEIIPTAGGPVFDPLKATEVGAMQTLNALLAPQRLNRLEGQHAGDAAVPRPAQLVDLLLGRDDGRSRRRRRPPHRDHGRSRACAGSARSGPVADHRIGAFGAAGPACRPASTPARLSSAAGLGAGARGLLKDREALDKAIADPARLPTSAAGHADRHG